MGVNIEGSPDGLTIAREYRSFWVATPWAVDELNNELNLHL